MNLFAAVMPGIREARTPLSVGALWMTAAFLALAPHWTVLSNRLPGLDWLLLVLAEVPELYLLGGAAFLAYLIGAAIQPVSVTFGKRILRPFYRAQRTMSYPEKKAARAFFSFVRRRLNVTEYLGPITDVIMNAYVNAGLPASLSLLYSNEKVLGHIDATALQLWKAEPDQYQEYDRLRAERDFRRGVWLPLIAVGVALSALVTWWLIPLFAVGGLILLFQTWGLDHRRTVLISNALFQGLVEDAELKGTVRILAALGLPKNWRDRESLRNAITAVAFAKAGDFDGADELTWEAAETAVEDIYFLGEDAQGRARRKAQRALAELAEEIRAVYRDNDELESLVVFDSRFVVAKERLEKRRAERAALLE